MSQRTTIFSLLCLLLLSFPVSLILAQDDQTEDIPQIPAATGAPQNYAFIFDASGSMRAGLAGRTRLAVAQDAMTQLTAELSPNVNASLWVFGHRLPQDDVAASCRDIEEVIPLGPVNVGEFERVVRDIQAIGYTPLSDSLLQAAASLPVGGDNTIILISDGEETCAGDPCAMTRELVQRDVNLIVNTIGFAVNESMRQQLECIAEVGGGIYIDAPGPDELTEALRQTTRIPGVVRIVDQDGAFLPEMPFTVARPAGDRVGNFSGSATLPEGEYVVSVQNDPPITQSITITSDEITEVTVQVIQLGAIALVNTDGERINDQAFNVISVTGEFLGQRTGEFTLPVGDYDVEIRVRVGTERTERALLERVTVEADQVTEVLVDFPSGIIRMLDPDGEPVNGFVTTITRQDTGEFLFSGRNPEFVVPPGDYSVTVVDRLSPVDVDVTVQADEVIEIVIETRRGFIVPVDENGEPTAATFQIINAETDALAHFTSADEFAVPPGTYTVNVREFGGYQTEVTVEAGERVTVPVITARGIIQPVDRDGNPVETTLEIIDTATGSALYYTRRDEFPVPPGTYSVTIRTQGFIASGSTEVTVAGDEVVEIPILEGFIVPVDGDGNPIRVTLRIVNTATGDQAHFSLSDAFAVPPGMYDVFIREPGFSADTPIQVEVGDGERVEIPLLEGFIVPVDGDGNPIRVTLRIVNTETGDQAHFSLNDAFPVPPGMYDVFIREPGFSGSPPVQVEVGGGATVEIALVVGFIVPVDTDGNRVDATLQIVDVETDGQAHFVRADEFPVPPGTYNVTTHDGERYTVQVEIEADQIVEIEIR